MPELDDTALDVTPEADALGVMLRQLLGQAA
jgi:hypothetical protein